MSENTGDWREAPQGESAEPEEERPPYTIAHDTPLETAVFEALGAASTCWESLEGTGVFDSDRARQIGVALMEHLHVHAAGIAAEAVQHMIDTAQARVAGGKAPLAAVPTPGPTRPPRLVRRRRPGDPRPQLPPQRSPQEGPDF